MECHFCRFGGGKHDVACPEWMSEDVNVPSLVRNWTKIQSIHDWQDGYRVGRSGREKPADAGATYSLGYREGVVALEEAENGEPFSDTADFNDDCRDEITEGEND